MRLVAVSDLNQPHHDPPIWYPAILLDGDRGAATLRYRPDSQEEWPEQSRELTPHCESYVNNNVRT